MGEYARLSREELKSQPQGWPDDENDGTSLACWTVNSRTLPIRTATVDRISSVEEFPAARRHPGGWSRQGEQVRFSADELLDDVRRALERNPEAARAAAVRLVTLLTPSAATESACPRGGLAPWQKRKVDGYLRQHLDQPLRLNEVAEQVSLSVSYFCRAFKESFGTTPHMHVIRLRLELAKRLMLTTEEPLSQIALACGLADQAHLSKLFRSVVGETPSAWRRSNITDAQVEARSRRETASRFVGPTSGCRVIAA
jgi:AraC family transcriptional regulator